MITQETLVRLEFHKLLSEIARHAHSDVTRERITGIAPLDSRTAIELLSGRIGELRALEQRGITLALSQYEDIRPHLELLKPDGAFLAPHDLLLFIPLLQVFSALQRQLYLRTDIPLITAMQPRLRSFPDILEPLVASIDQDGGILDSASSFLRETRKAKRSLAARIRKKIEEIVRANNIEIFLQDDFITQRSGRWVIPVRMDSKGMVKGVVHDVSSSGETAFMEPLEIIPFVNELESLNADEKAEEIRILKQLSSWIREESDDLVSCFETLVTLDLINCIARYATEYGLQPASLNDSGEFVLVDARHPILLMLQKNRALDRVEPLGFRLEKGISALDTQRPDGVGEQPSASVMVITGPNAGGKTIALKTAGILALMALSGLPVPAGANTTVPFFDTLLVDIGDEQSIEQSHSTYSAHVARIAAILQQAGGRTLALLDELGAGTEPLQGAAIACGVLRELQHRGAMVVATTHLSDIIGFVHRTPGMINAGMEFDDANFMPLYRLITGEPGQSHAVEIARRFGMPEQVIAFARQMLGSAGSEFASLLDELRRRRGELEQRVRTIEARESGLAEQAQELEQRAAGIEAACREAREKARIDARDLISASRRRMNELLENLKQDNRHEVVSKLRQEETDLTRILEPEADPQELAADERLLVGQAVRIRSLGYDAVVISVDERGGKVRVRAGRMELELTRSDLAHPVVTQSKQKVRKPVVTLKTAQDESEPREIYLIGMRVDEALAELEPFLNHAVTAGVREVRIIHGIGSGRLKNAVREELERSPLVDGWRAGTEYEGRDGATIVTLQT